MYTLIKTIARSYQRELGVREINAPDVNIRTLLRENLEVLLVLKNTYLSGTHTLNLNTVVPLIYNTSPTLTVSQWLAHIGNQTLPTTVGEPVLTTHVARMVDAYVAGFVVQTSTGFTGTDTGDVLDIDRPHLSLKKVGTEYLQMHRHVLAAVGGYLHLTDADPTGYYIKEGATTMRIAKSPKVNLISLDKIGSFSLIPIANCTITPRRGTELHRGFTLTTDRNLANKTVWLSIGGYLLNLNRGYRQINDKSIVVDWNQLNIHLKYLTAKQFIDLSAVEATLSFQDDGVIDKTSLNSNGAILSYLHLSQSFLIAIDNPSIYVDMVRLEDTGLPGKYYAYQHPMTPMVTHDGRLPPISLIDERKAWVVSTSVLQGRVNDYYGEKMNPTATSLYTKRKFNDRPHRRASLYSMRITSTTIT